MGNKQNFNSEPLNFNENEKDRELFDSKRKYTYCLVTDDNRVLEEFRHRGTALVQKSYYEKAYGQKLRIEKKDNEKYKP